MSETLTAKLRRAHSPIDRLASQVISPGTHYEYIRGDERIPDSPEPLATKPYPLAWPKCDDLTGMAFGRFQAIGLSAEKNPKKGNKGKGPKWVVRCKCGLFSVRRTKHLLFPNDPSRLMCDRCDHVEAMRKT